MNEVGCILTVGTEFLPDTAKVVVLTSFPKAPVPAGLTGAAAAWREGDPEKPGGNFRSRDSSVVSDAGAIGRQTHLLCCDLCFGDVLSPQPRLPCTGQAYSSRTQPKTLSPTMEISFMTKI